MFAQLYKKTIDLSSHPYALWFLSMVAFAESSFFPIPPDILIIPMVIADRAKAWIIAMVATVSSVFGGLFGYILGLFLFQSVGLPLLDFYHYHETFDKFTTAYHEWGPWIVIAGGLTPIPYKLITIASGVTALELPVFIIASLLSRGTRFFLLAWIMWWLGPQVKPYIEKHITLLGFLFLFILVGSFYILKVL